MQQVARFDYILTDTEIEALILEYNLIKQHRPTGERFSPGSARRFASLCFYPQDIKNQGIFARDPSSSSHTAHTAHGLETRFAQPESSASDDADIGPLQFVIRLNGLGGYPSASRQL
jgi:hypothetical protein